MKIIYISLFILFLGVSFSACTSQTKESQTPQNSPSSEFQSPTITNNTKDDSGNYVSAEFNFSMKLPDKWNVTEYVSVPSKTSIKSFGVADIKNTELNSVVGTITTYYRQDGRSASDLEKTLASEDKNNYRTPVYLSSDIISQNPNKLRYYSRKNVSCRPLLCDLYLVTTDRYFLQFKFTRPVEQTPDSISYYEPELIKSLINSVKEVK